MERRQENDSDWYICRDMVKIKYKEKGLTVYSCIGFAKISKEKPERAQLFATACLRLHPKKCFVSLYYTDLLLERELSLWNFLWEKMQRNLEQVLKRSGLTFHRKFASYTDIYNFWGTSTYMSLNLLKTTEMHPSTSKRSCSLYLRNKLTPQNHECWKALGNEQNIKARSEVRVK